MQKLGMHHDPAEDFDHPAIPEASPLRRLVLTRRYWLLQSMPGNAGTPPVTTLLNAELDERWRVFDAAETALREQIERWSRPGEFVVPDTSFYITHGEKLEDADFVPLLG